MHVLLKCHKFSEKFIIISIFAFMNSATSNIFVSDVDTADFWRTNGSKLEAGPISPQRLRRNRLSKFRDDSKHFSPISTVLSFSHKVKYLEHTLASLCQMFSQNNMRPIYRTKGSDSDYESFQRKCGIHMETNSLFLKSENRIQRIIQIVNYI